MSLRIESKSVAIAHAVCAQLIVDAGSHIISSHKALVPILVNALFQSLELTLKVLSVATGAIAFDELRGREFRRGHGIKEIAIGVVNRLGFANIDPLVTALTFSSNSPANSFSVVKMMLIGDEFATARDCYWQRKLGYAEVVDGDFCVVSDIKQWVGIVKFVAENVDSAIQVVSQWSASDCAGSYAIFCQMDATDIKSFVDA